MKTNVSEQNQREWREHVFRERLSPRVTRAIRCFAVCTFFLFFFFSFLERHLYNYDFWWHLANGKYIVENKSLPQKDPFAYTTPEAPSKRKSLILKGYWLAETIFYEVYKSWNVKGIIILRSLLMSLFLFFVFLTIKKQAISDFLALIFVTGVFIFSQTTLGERPQLFTFLFFSVVYYLLENFRINGSKKVFLIPVIVLFLSNMHPGYIVCIFLITLYVTGTGFLYFSRKQHSIDFKALSLIWVLSIIFALFNPSGLNVFAEMFTLGKHTEDVVEFMPTFSLYMKKVQPLDYSYLIFLGLSLLSVRYLKKIGIVHMLLLVTFTIMSFASIRYVIFYMCISAPILAIRNVKNKKYYAIMIE